MGLIMIQNKSELRDYKLKLLRYFPFSLDINSLRFWFGESNYYLNLYMERNVEGITDDNIFNLLMRAFWFSANFFLNRNESLR